MKTQAPINTAMRLNDLFLTEGVHDPAIFKAVFLAGSPGAGKSSAMRRLFSPHTAMTGLRPVDIDHFAEMLAGIRKPNPNYRDPEYADIFQRNISIDRQDPRVEDLYKRAWNLRNARRDLLIRGRLGMIIDGTGRHMESVKRMGDYLRSMGYDIMMIFVNTSLSVALKRNRQRQRVIPNDMLERMHQEVQRNLGMLQNYFGDNFLIIDNDDPDAAEKWTHAEKKIQQFIRKPVHNPTALQWIKDQSKGRHVAQ